MTHSLSLTNPTFGPLLRAGFALGLGSAIALSLAPAARSGSLSVGSTDSLDTAAPPQFAQRLPERDTLTLGSEGDDVRELQAILTLLGHYSGAINGRFDSRTARATRDFQNSAGLLADAVVGPVTWGYLLPALLADGTVDSDPVTTAGGSSNSGNTVPLPDRYRDRTIDRPTLRLGSNSIDVSFVQRQLADWGYYSGEIDGDYGPVTEAAVIEMQLDYGIDPTGVVGPITWSYLDD